MSRSLRNGVQPRPLSIRWLAALAAAALACLAYLPALDLGFVNWDDPDYVTANPNLNLPLGEFVRWTLTARLHGNWHPVTWWSLKVDLAIGGGAPAPFHATSVLLHAANSALVVLVALALTAATGKAVDRRAAVAAGALGSLFAVHPLHVESVAWVAERKDVLYAFFWLFSLLAFLRCAEPGPSRRTSYTVSLVSFVAALASKPMAVTLVPLLVLCDLWPLRRLRRDAWKTAALEKLPYVIVAAGIAAVTLAGQRAAGAMPTLDQLSLARRLAGAILNLGFYVAKSIVPIHLSPLYPVHEDATSIAPEQVLGLLAFVAWCLVGWRFRARQPAIGFAAAGFALSLAPILGLFQAGSQMAADRYAYLALAFPAGVLVLVAAALTGRLARAQRPLFVVFLVVLATLTLGARAQLRHWNDSRALWSRVLRYAPGHPSAHYNLGEHYRDQGDLHQAARHWQAAVAADPEHSQALNQLANLELLAGNLPAAEELYRRSVAADEDNVEALFNLILTLDRLGRFHETAAWVDRFLALAGPEYAGQQAWLRRRREEISTGRLPDPTRSEGRR